MFAIGEICLSRNRIAACVEPYAEPTVRGRAMRLTSRLKHPTWAEPGVFLSSGISARTRKYMPARYCECHVNGVHCVLQFSKKKGTHCCATVFWLIVFLTFIQNKQFVGNGRLWAHSGTNGECPTGSGCAQRNPAVPNGIRLCPTESGYAKRNPESWRGPLARALGRIFASCRWQLSTPRSTRAQQKIKELSILRSFYE